jgi:hypothetical protein
MPIDPSLSTLESFSRRLLDRDARLPRKPPDEGGIQAPSAIPTLADQPLLGILELGRIEVQVLEPAGPLPDRWTRFKAALACVPLIGCLGAVRKADAVLRGAVENSRQREGLLLQAHQFGEQFKSKLKSTFGDSVCEQSFAEQDRAEGAPPAPPVTGTPLTAQRVVGVTQNARRIADECAKANSRALLETLEPHFVDSGRGRWIPLFRDYAHALAMSRHPEFAHTRLEPQVFEELWKDQQLSALLCLRDNLTPSEQRQLKDRLLQQGRAFRAKIERAPLEGRQDIADRFLEQLGRQREQLENRQEVWLGCPEYVKAAGINPWHADYARLVHALCMHGSSFDPGRIPWGWEQLAKIRASLASELSRDRNAATTCATDLLLRCALDVSAISPGELQQRARESWIVQQMRDWSRNRYQTSGPNPSAAHSMPGAPGMPPGATLIDQVLKGMATQMLDPALIDQPPQPWSPERFARKIDTLQSQCAEKIEEVQYQHQQALQLIEKSEDLTPHQKQLLLEQGSEIAQPLQWLHPVHLNLYLYIADTITNRLPAIGNAIETNDPVALLERLSELDDDLCTAMRQIRQAAKPLWLSHTLEGDEVQQRALHLCVKLALAKQADSPLPEAAPPQTALEGQLPQRSFDDAGSQLKRLLSLSQTPSAARLLALCEGLRPAPAAPPALHLIRPELLVRRLVRPHVALDDRGVLQGFTATHQVANDFQLKPIANKVSQTASSTPSRPLPDMFKAALMGGDIILNGERLGERSQDTSQILERFQEEFKDDKDIAQEIGRCISCGAMDRFREEVNQTAFGAPPPMAHQRGVHEVWQEPDGSWRVRSTHVSHPLAQGLRISAGGNPGAAPLPLNTDGVVLYTLTHRIAEGPDQKPRITLEDHQVTFAF